MLTLSLRINVPHFQVYEGFAKEGNQLFVNQISGKQIIVSHRGRLHQQQIERRWWWRQHTWGEKHPKSIVSSDILQSVTLYPWRSA